MDGRKKSEQTQVRAAAWRQLVPYIYIYIYHLYVCIYIYVYVHGAFVQLGGTLKSFILVRFSIINHPFWGTSIMETPWNPHILAIIASSITNSTNAYSCVNVVALPDQREGSFSLRLKEFGHDTMGFSEGLRSPRNRMASFSLINCCKKCEIVDHHWEKPYRSCPVNREWFKYPFNISTNKRNLMIVVWPYPVNFT